MNKIYEQLSKTSVEREVEQIYNENLKKYLKVDDIEHPYECDGYIKVKSKEGKDLRLLIEYKYDEDLKTSSGRAKVLIQTLYYIKQFEKAGSVPPNVIMIADKNECSLVHFNNIYKYLNEDVDWKVAPSQAWMKNPELLLKLASDENLNTWVYDVNDNFDFVDVIRRIGDLTNNVIRKVHISEDNVDRIFEYFVSNVWKDKKLSSHDVVGIFIGLITNPDQYYVHPNNKNTVIAPSGQYSINGKEFKKLFDHFDTNLSPSEYKYIISIADRLIEDCQRRKSGDFWTPKVWVDESHRRISKLLGDDWKEKYVVWDNCCGGKNLTRDYRFKELYSSTLFQSELDMSSKYNPEGTAFQFDFLNDDLDKLPLGLKDALEQDKPFVFFLNPPYKKGTAEVFNGGKGVQNTNIQKDMKKDGIGRTVLSDQFLYRICKICEQYHLSNVYIFIYSGTAFLRASSNKHIRKFYLDRFNYRGGYLINAGEFSNVSNTWGICFTEWNIGKSIHYNTFNVDVLQTIDFEVVNTQQKVLYNIDGLNSMHMWTDKDITKTTPHDVLQLKVGLEPVKIDVTTLPENIGYFIKHANAAPQSSRLQFLQCTPKGKGSAKIIPITNNTFNKVICGFTAMNLPIRNWLNGDDEFTVPNIYHPLYKQFELDSVIFSIFKDSQSYQTSTDHDYEGRHWNIDNQFFWMSKEEMKELADKNNNVEVYNDADTDDERYVYKYIKEHWDEFSPDAQEVYNKACEIIRKSFPYRSIYNEDHPEIQINHWDAGWYQVKYILKEYMKEDLKEFKKVYRKMEDRMRPLVYELGFLRK